MSVVVFLPCRKGSQRVPHKNIKSFAGNKKGLLEVKLNQLIAVKSINRIVLSSNDEQVLDYAKKLNCSKISFYSRDDRLATNECSTDQLISHALELIPKGEILWTHVTSPFLSSSHYTNIIKKYFLILNQGYDSLMTVNVIKNFLWNKKGPINYSRKIEKWPRTQTIKSTYEINSGLFMANSEIYLKCNDRIGKKPYLYELDKISGFDIDWNEDFKIAESISKLGVKID